MKVGISVGEPRDIATTELRGGPGAVAWGELLTRQARDHGRLFYRLAFGLLRNAAAAEDACQQALLKAWGARKDITGPAMLNAWLVRTVVNESIQVLRRRKVERRAFDLGISDVISANHAPSHVALFLREDLLAALAQLPDSTRSIVVLRVMEGMHGKEVSELVGCSAGEVSRRLHRGLEHLRGILGSDEDRGRHSG